jgi:mRNA-degrading endonuclease toxin of MazEF toxin-antitoxin module
MANTATLSPWRSSEGRVARLGIEISVATYNALATGAMHCPLLEAQRKHARRRPLLPGAIATPVSPAKTLRSRHSNAASLRRISKPARDRRRYGRSQEARFRDIVDALVSEYGSEASARDYPLPWGTDSRREGVAGRRRGTPAVVSAFKSTDK